MARSPRPHHFALPLIVVLVATLASAVRAEVRARDEQFVLDSVEISTLDVFEGVTPIPVVGGLIEHLHAVTRQKTIRSEIRFAEGDTITRHDLAELELNLRRLSIFSDIDIETVDADPGDDEEGEVPRRRLVVRTRDSWSLRVNGGYHMTEDGRSYNVGIREMNILGRAKQLGVSADYSSVEDRGWSYGASYLNPNIFGSGLQISSSFVTGREEKGGAGALTYPFYHDRQRHAFQGGASHFSGREGIYQRSGDAVFFASGDLRRTSASLWYAGSNGRPGDVFRASVAATFNHVERQHSAVPLSAFENSIGIFGGISSQRREYVRITGTDFSGLRQVAIGGAGSVSVGKISPHSGGLDNVVYIGGEARRSFYNGDLYAYAAIEAGTGLQGKSARFTTERVLATGAMRLGPGAIAARFEQSTVWNWPRHIDVSEVTGSPLRGYRRETLVGDNRIIGNLEYRLNSIGRVWIFDLGMSAFYDIGSAWSQATRLDQARFHSSAGLGIRISNADAQIERGLLRLDVAYNFDERRIGRIILSSRESFDAFGTLDYRPPAPYSY